MEGGYGELAQKCESEWNGKGMGIGEKKCGIAKFDGKYARKINKQCPKGTFYGWIDKNMTDSFKQTF